MENKVKTPQKTNALAVIGLITAFFAPLIGLVLSIIGLVQVNKRKEKGKGLAISGIVASVIVGILQLLTLILIIGAVSSTKVELVTYTNSEVGYSVKYPEGWTQETNNTSDAKDTVFKDKLGDTGKVYGQVEVVYVPAPENGYTKDVLDAIADAIVKDNANTTVVYRDRTTKDGRPTLTLVTTYKGESETVKSKTTIILNDDNSVYTVSTQTPEKNWDKYSDEFDEIHNTFSP
jgi:hypothetical protein